MKQKRDTGQAYISCRSKQEVPAKILGLQCHRPRKCDEVAGEGNAQLIFDGFWKIGSHNAQTSYIINWVVTEEVKRHYVTHESKRKCSREYSVKMDNKIIPVSCGIF